MKQKKKKTPEKVKQRWKTKIGFHVVLFVPGSDEATKNKKKLFRQNVNEIRHMTPQNRARLPHSLTSLCISLFLSLSPSGSIPRVKEV